MNENKQELRYSVSEEWLLNVIVKLATLEAERAQSTAMVFYVIAMMIVSMLITVWKFTVVSAILLMTTACIAMAGFILISKKFNSKSYVKKKTEEMEKMW